MWLHCQKISEWKKRKVSLCQRFLLEEHFPEWKEKNLILFNFAELNLIAEEIRFWEFFFRVYDDCNIPIHLINNLYMTFTFIWFQMDEWYYSLRISLFLLLFERKFTKRERKWKEKNTSLLLYKKQLYNTLFWETFKKHWRLNRTRFLKTYKLEENVSYVTKRV